MRVALDSWVLKLSRVSASTTLPGSWFQRRMACGKNDLLCTVVLVCGTMNLSEWTLVRREVRLRWCSAGISTRLYTMRYINTVWAYARLICSVSHWSCCSLAVTLLEHLWSPVANLANLAARRCTASTLLILSFLLGFHMLDAYSRVSRTKVA